MKKLFVIASIVALCGLPVKAQTNTTLPTAPQPSPQQSWLVNALSLHNPTLEYFTNDISVELEQAAKIDSALPGTLQSTTLDLWKRIGTSTELGGDAEIDTLGVDNDINGIFGHVDLRLDWDNIAGGLSLGGGRQITLQTTRIEGGFFAEYRVIPNVGANLRWYAGYQPDGVAKKAYTALLLGITVGLGK